MPRRLVRCTLGLALLAPTALAVAPVGAAEAARARWDLAAPSRFSPNRDGVKDELRIRITVPQRTHLRLAIGPASERTVDRRVDLGTLSAGTHTWTWNGRNQSGKQVSDRAYSVRLYDVTTVGYATALATEKVQVDTSFAPTLTAPTYGADPGKPARVYPRTTVVQDSIALSARVWDEKIGRFELVIRNPRGRVVRRADLDEDGPGFGTGRTVPWAAVRGGRALPPGRYTAVATGRDLAGNTGRSAPVRIWVSDDALEWQERTETVTPVGTAYSEPCLGSGCGDYQPCGTVVPSALFAEGLSYRSVECTGPFRYPLASRRHFLPVPAGLGVRGVAEAKVGFTGSPTTAGEGDAGELSLRTSGEPYASVRGSTGGETPWAADLYGGAGRVTFDEDENEVTVPPGVEWSFTTRGSASVDVDRFTVTYRYLAPA